MAGIGFTLKRYFEGGDLLKLLKGSFYSIFISSGPWLITVLSIAIISTFTRRNLEEGEVLLFKSMISYSFAFSLVYFGMIEMPITRYLADKLFIKDFGPLRPLFFMFSALNALVAASIAGVFYSFSDMPLYLKVSGVALFAAVIAVWTAMIFLSAAKNYKRIVYSFLIGGCASVGLSFLFGEFYGLPGYVVGFTLGEIILAVLLSFFVHLEFNFNDYISFESVSYFKKHRFLMAAGFLYYSGIWVDKFIFWYSDQGENIEGLFYTNRLYDTAMFLAYLSIVPSMAVFLVQIETQFYIKYAHFFRAIDAKDGLHFLQYKVAEMIESLKRSISIMLKVQAFISLLCWYFADVILEAFFLPARMGVIFKYGIVGAFLQIFFLIINIILLYFGAEFLVFCHYALFFISNLILSLYFLDGGLQVWGLGYCLSCFIVSVVSMLSLNYRLKNVNYFVFMTQPLSRKQFSQEM